MSSSDEETTLHTETTLSHDSDLSSSEDEEEASQTAHRIYNAPGLLEKLEEIRLAPGIAWVEYPAITSGFTHEGVDAEDDFEREVSLYKSTVAGCTEAQVYMERVGLNYKRPADYFAEMLKSDAHMAKVRQSLLDQQKRIEAVEERRRQRELKRFGKKVQVEKEQTRAKQKKSELDAIKKWRKDQKRNTSTGGDGSEHKEIENVLASAAQDKDSKKGPAAPKKNLKRKRKDAQYGFGGTGKRAKKNTADSSASLASFSLARNKSVDSDLHPLIPKFAANRGPKRRTAQPKKVHRAGKK